MPPQRHTPIRKGRVVPYLPELIFKRRRCLFDKLPIELLQQIGLEMETREELEDYAFICKSTYFALESDKRAFWRLRFLKTFDQPDWRLDLSTVENNTRFKREYLFRRKILSGDQKHFGFASGFQPDELDTLKFLVGLVKEASFTISQSTGEVSSRNLQVLDRFVRRASVYRLFEWDSAEEHAKSYDVNGEPRWNSMLLMLQCLITPTIVSVRQLGDTVLGFSVSQAIVYASEFTRPLHERGEVDFNTLLHHVNFWKYHFLFDRTGDIIEWYADLPLNQRPSYWQEKLSDISLILNKSWKGTYAYIDDHKYFRFGPDGTTINGQRFEEILQDCFLGDGQESPFQDLEMSVCDPKDHYWPALFSRFLPTSRQQSRPITRAQNQAFQEVIDRYPPVPISACITGGGTDQGDHFSMSGWLEQLPDQHGVPGWSRIILMKYYVDEITRQVDDECLWAYEGIILPGGRIIMGRWWHPTLHGSLRHAYRGPFILWAVEDDG